MKLMKEYFSVPKTKIFFVVSIVFSILKTILNAHMIWTVSRIIESIVSGGNWEQYLVLFIIEQFAFAIAQFIREIVWRKITQRSYTELANRAVYKMLSVDYDTFTSSGEGRMHSVLDSVSSIANTGKAFLGAVNATSSLIIMIIAIWKIHNALIVPIFIIYGICAYPIWKLNKRIGKCDEKVTLTKRQRSNAVQRIVSGFAELRATSMQEHHREEFDKLNQDTYNAIDKKVKTIACYIFLLNVIDILVSGSIVLLGVGQIRNGLAPTLVMTLVVYGWELMNPMSNLIDCLDEYSAYKAEFHVYKEFMETPITVKDGTVELTSFNSAIEFNGVSFQYSKSDEVLSDISFKINKGEKIGVVGQSGCGKTTLLKLIERFYDVTSGSICIDGLDTKELTLESLRDKIGYVQQDSFIFKGSILDNLVYGTKRILTMRTIEHACEKAAILDFIKGLPDGFETDIGPGGLKLSGGQRQRIALARIFLRDPDIILLDEATSALDNECENIVQESLALFKDKTIITVAHRLTTIKDSDRILVFNDHRLVDSGNHYELLAKGGVYFDLWNAKETH